MKRTNDLAWLTQIHNIPISKTSHKEIDYFIISVLKITGLKYIFFEHKSLFKKNKKVTIFYKIEGSALPSFGRGKIGRPVTSLTW